MALTITTVPVDAIVSQRDDCIGFAHIHGSDAILKMIDIAFYTCYLGPDGTWSNKVHPPPSSNHPCYYFTNNYNTFERAKKAGWAPVWMDVPVEESEIHNIANTKVLRCCPHLFEVLVPHTHLCYLDSKLWITDLDGILSVAKELTDERPLALSLHPFRDRYITVWDEFEEAMLQYRYACQRSRYVTYMNNCLRIGFQNCPLRHACGFRIQKQGELARRIGESWYAHIGLCGIEDQISWQFVVQQFPGSVLEIPYKGVWNAL